MAAGVYGVDLQDINLAETNTNWNDVNQAGGGGANSAEVDFAIQGTNAITRQVNNTRRGVLYDTGSTVTLGADEHIFVWTVCATPGIADIKSNGGVRVSIGTSTNNYYDFYVNGSDTLPKGGMKNYAVYYAAASASLQNGSPGANPQFFGAQASTVGTAKGDNFACDAIRRGTGFYITEGDATTPITFVSASIVNDSNANRYGILSAGGGGYNLKGRFVIGQDPNLNTTQSYFDDANTFVTFVGTDYTKDDFTQIIIDHPSTFFKLSGINFTGVNTFNAGQIVFNNSSTTGSFINCNLNTIGKTFLQANVVVSGSGWASCDTVFQSGSTLFDSAFRTTVGASASILVDDPSLIRQCVFDNEGSKHGIEVIVTGSYVFNANLFSNFDSGSNANEALYFNPPGGTGDLTLQLTNGGTNINFRNASSGTVTIENNATITITGVEDNTEIRVLSTIDLDPGGGQLELAGIENTSGGSWPFTLEIGTVVDIALISLQYQNLRINNFTITQTQDLPVSQRFDRNYSNPT
jgi:hypothetical protein